MKSVKGELDRYPVEGEVVLIRDEGLPRGSWKIAKISSLIKTEMDDIPRAAKVVTSNGKTFKRPLKELYPLEIFQ